MKTKSKLSKKLRSELKKLPEIEVRVKEQHERVWDLIQKQGGVDDFNMLYEVTQKIPSSYLRFTVFEQIYELDPEERAERVGKKLSPELYAELHKYAELFQKREEQVQRIENLAASEGVFDDAEKLGEAVDRITQTYLQYIFWDRYSELTHRYVSILKNRREAETGGNK